jgi:hypothetical protein
MSRKGSQLFLFLLCTFINFQTFGQLSELDFGTLSVNENKPTELQNALNYYHNGSYSKAYVYFNNALFNNELNKEHYLFFANTRGVISQDVLVFDYFNEYIKSQNGVRNDYIGKIISQIKDSNKMYEFKIQEQLEGGKHFTYFDKKIYISQSGQIHSFLVSPNNRFIYYDREFKKFRRYNLNGVAFLNNGQVAVFGVLDLNRRNVRLYYSELKKKGWSRLKKIPTLDKSLNAAFPANNPNSNKLFFAYEGQDSYGGYDIYVCSFENGKWSVPLNLGDKVNSSGNEIMPFVENKNLRYSSNGFPTFGGFDIFEVPMKNLNSYPRNIMQINGPNDDFVFHQMDSSDFIYLKRKLDISYLEIVKRKKIVAKSEIPKEKKESKPVVSENKSNPKKNDDFYTLQLKNSKSQNITNAIIILNPDHPQGSFFRVDKNGILKLNNDFDVESLNIRIIADGYSDLITEWQKNTYQMVVLTAENVVTKEDLTKKNIEVVKEKDNVTKKEASKNIAVKTDYPEKKSTTPNPSVKNESKSPTKLKEKVEDKKDVNTFSTYDKSSYYIIIGSSTKPDRARQLQSEFVNSFENIEIVQFNTNLYRIGLNVGKSEEDAIAELQRVRNVVYDAWLLRP